MSIQYLMRRVRRLKPFLVTICVFTGLGCFSIRYNPVVVPSNFQNPVPGVVVYEGAFTPPDTIVATPESPTQEKYLFDFQQAGHPDDVGDSVAAVKTSLKKSLEQSDLFDELIIPVPGGDYSLFRRGKPAPADTVASASEITFLRVDLEKVQSRCEFTCYAQIAAQLRIRRGVKAKADAPGSVCLETKSKSSCYIPGPELHTRGFTEKGEASTAYSALEDAIQKVVPRVLAAIAEVGKSGDVGS